MHMSAGEIVVGVLESKVMPEDTGAQVKSSVSTWCCSNWRPLLAEFIATAILMCMGCMTTLPFEGQNSTLYAPLGFGFVVLFNVQIFAHLSGAHMNPAVTLASVIWGRTSITLGIAYFLTQCAGALAGFGVLTALSPMDVVTGGVCVTRPLLGVNDIQAVGIETAITAVLSFMCCALWDPINESKQDSAPIKFSLTIVGLTLVAGPWTGASMNPARSLAPAVFTGIWTVHWAYWVGPLLGSSIAAIIYKLIFLNKKIS